MKTIRYFICLVALFCSLQSNAIAPVSSIQNLVCGANFTTDPIAFVGEYLQHVEVLEELNGEPATVYLVQYSVTDLWCGEVITEFEPNTGAPIWAADFENTDSEVWIAIRPLEGIFDVPELNQRQFVSASTHFNSVYLTTNRPGSETSFSSGPLDISEIETVTGNLTGAGEIQTLTLTELRNELSICSTCSIGSGIDNAPMEIGLYPNPASQFINFQSNDLQDISSYRIYNVSGQLVQSGVVHVNQKIEVDELVTGLYFVSVVGLEGRRGVSEFIKE